MSKSLERVSFWHKWSPLFLAMAILGLLIFAWGVPVSISYLVRACLIGLAFGVLTIAYCRWESARPSRLVWSTLSVVLVAGGFYWSKDQTYGVASAWSWRLAGQFVAMVLAACFASVIVARIIDTLQRTRSQGPVAM